MIEVPCKLNDEVTEKISGLEGKYFFNDPQYAWLRDIWIAAKFGMAFEAFIDECRIEIDDSNDQRYYDFKLHVRNDVYPFQSTEVMEPERRRGLEYKKRVSTFDQEYWKWPPDDFNQQIRESISKKYDKYKSGSKDINLLIRVNIFGFKCEYDTIKEYCSAINPEFRSVWVQSSKIFGAIYEKEEHFFVSSSWFESEC